ncbi:antitoxin YezG family protein [Bacillus inaquosorum]|uniref:antitoxin YezG family protein n=1 Tax=Bacillus inaquosorum TaxID=483913 RepID=UPI0002D641B3|nr:antitoxin YezG family protein [Bacillus inaquosorum]MED4648445.1 antitoxin YezG family protein [Bacillus inaquosorum]MED4792609.1 antitoxin YezG family protein [Bacillus inaquosorum]
METEKMGQLYQQIAEQLNEMIPSEWTKIILYAEILDDSSEVYFFFNTPQSEEYIYSHDIPKQFDVSKKIYVSLLIELQELFEELREEFKANNQDTWTNLTLKLENTGKFSIDYDYTDVIASDLNGTQRQVIWEYKNLGILPEDKKEKDFVINYLGL